MNKLNIFGATLGFLISTQALAAGGVGSGGGGLLSGQPVSVGQVERQVLNRSRPLVIGYLQAREYAYHRALAIATQPSDLDKKLFGGRESVLSRISKVKIDVKETSACLDRDGTEFDGSAVDPASDNICVSTFRIAPKVNENSMKYEVPALILHEISHLMGFDEAEAQALQYDYIRKNFRMTYGMGGPLSDEAGEIWQTREGFGILMDRLGTAMPTCRETEFITQHIHRLRDVLKLTHDDISWLDATSTDEFMGMRIKARAISNLICSWDKSLDQSEIDSYLKDYLSGFGTASSTETGTYGETAWPGLGWNGFGLAKTTMRKCADVQCAETEIEDIWMGLMEALKKMSGFSRVPFEKL